MGRQETEIKVIFQRRCVEISPTLVHAPVDQDHGLPVGLCRDGAPVQERPALRWQLGRMGAMPMTGAERNRLKVLTRLEL